MSSGVGRPRRLAAGLAELGVVGGFGLLAAVWIIPAQTTSGPVLGLPPWLLPTVCAVAILVLALATFAAGLGRAEEPAAERPPLRGAAGVIGATIAGALALRFAGPVAGGLAALGLSTLAVGERRPFVIAATLAAGGALLAFVFLR